MRTTFRPPSKSLTPRDYQFIAVVVLVVSFLFAILIVANLRVKDGGGDFFVQWVASRAFLFDKIEPYGGDVARRVQELVHTSAFQPRAKAHVLVTPFHLLLLCFPIALIPDPAVARAVYLGILQLALITLAYLSLRIAGWSSPARLTVLCMIAGAANSYAFQALLEGSSVIVLGLLFAGILISLRAEVDVLTGGLIALSLYHWEVGAPFLLLILLRGFQERRAGLFAGLFMASAVLLAISFLLYPDWIIPFLRATVNSARFNFGFSIHGLFIRLWPGLGQTYAWILIWAILIILVYEISSARGGNLPREHWVACLTIAATPLLGFRTESGSLVVLVLPLALVYSSAYTRWRSPGNALATLFVLAVLIIPWLAYYLAVTRNSRGAQEFAFVFLPVLTIVGLYWIRWWAFNRPRSWVDDLART